MLLVLAIAWTLGHAFLPGQRDATWLAVLDFSWPLSMLGMFAIGIRIAVAGRWKGLTRFWPVVAESWAVVVIPTMGIFGEAVASVVAGTHLLVGYTVLGLLVARKER